VSLKVYLSISIIYLTFSEMMNSPFWTFITLTFPATTPFLEQTGWSWEWFLGPFVSIQVRLWMLDFILMHQQLLDIVSLDIIVSKIAKKSSVTNYIIFFLRKWELSLLFKKNSTVVMRWPLELAFDLTHLKAEYPTLGNIFHVTCIMHSSVQT
jgi:hypothetical protein